MASVGQSTAGIKVYYGTGSTKPSNGSWIEIPNVTGYPDLVSDPNTADVTPLSETTMVINIPLLMDIGILAFPAVMTSELVGVVDAAAAASNAWFRIDFPAPLALHYYAPCEFEQVYPTGTDANNAVTCTVRLTPREAIKKGSGVI